LRWLQDRARNLCLVTMNHEADEITIIEYNTHTLYHLFRPLIKCTEANKGHMCLYVCISINDGNKARENSNRYLQQ